MVFFLLDLSFPSIFFLFYYFYVFVDDLLRHVVVLLVGFCVDGSNGRAVSIIQRSHINSLLVIMHHQIMNLMYSKHLRITNRVGLELFFFFSINLDIVSSFNVFSTLVYVFRCKVLLLWINTISQYPKKKKKSTNSYAQKHDKKYLNFFTFSLQVLFIN